MALDNSVIQHPLPGNLQQRVENALNQVTLQEAEFNRLSKLCIDEKDKINQGQVLKKDLESKIKTLTANFTEASKSLDQKHTQLDEIEHQIKDAKHDLDEVKREIESLTESKSKLEKEIELKIKEQSDKENDIIRRHKELEVSEEAHRKQVARLKEALN